MANRVTEKTGHVLGQVWMGLKRGAQIGAIGGALIGIGMLVAGTAAVTIPALVGYTIAGGVIGSLCGMNTGGFVGGIKGLLTRAKPKGDAIMQEANACAQDGVEQQPQQGQEQAAPAPQVAPAPAPQDLPAPKGSGKNPAPSAVSVSNPQATAPAAGNAMPAGALAELQAMTQTLNEMQTDAAAAQAQPAAQQPQTAAPAQQPPQNWQARVEQQQAQGAERQR